MKISGEANEFNQYRDVGLTCRPGKGHPMKISNEFLLNTDNIVYCDQCGYYECVCPFQQKDLRNQDNLGNDKKKREKER